jgi:hypothetical protein
MRAHLAILGLAATAALAAPSLARADVPIEVPVRFLGGPIWAPQSPGAAPAPGAGRPSRAPASADPCAGELPEDCVIIGPDAEVDEPPFPTAGPGPGPAPPEDEPDTPDDPADDAPALAEQELARAVPAIPPTVAELEAAFGGLVAPAAASWLPWQTPLLRWRATPGARYYNVQVFRGARRVVNAWTRAPRLRLPADALEQGRTYVWTVWPGAGPRRQARYGMPVGRSLFAVTLRPRIVLHRHGRTLVAETRPRIPGGLLALSGRAVRRGRAPARVALNAGGFFRLDLGRPAAERLSARLLAPGPRPPVGLRGLVR